MKCKCEGRTISAKSSKYSFIEIVHLKINVIHPHWCQIIMHKSHGVLLGVYWIFMIPLRNKLWILHDFKVLSSLTIFGEML